MQKIYFDELTGCYNRRFLRYWIDNEIKRANRFSTSFALILLDIDDFRHVNNSFGHLEGDKVLIAFSEFLRINIREVDSLVRYGGDEFIILMPNTDEKGTIELAQRIIANLDGAKIINHTISCSIGFAVFPEDGTTDDGLINQADSLMYQAKKQGKNRVGTKGEVIRKLQIPSPVTVGREDEAKWCLRQMKDYSTVFIAGEAGIGKTRLVYEIKELFDTQIVLHGNAYAALAAVPYHPFKNMFNELVNQDFGLIQRIFKQLPEIFQSEIMKILPAEGFVRSSEAEGLDKFRLYNAVSEFILTLSSVLSPTVTIVLVDDLHWLDKPSCELLDFLIRSARNSVKIFGTYRVEEIKSAHVSPLLNIWAREKLYTQLMLSPLNENQTQQLLRAVMGTIPHTAAKFIYRESGGNPFYVEEIVRELEREKKIYWNGSEWMFVRNLEVAIPSSIEGTIQRKLSFLDQEIKNFLKIAAVYGQEFVPEIIAIASSRNVGQILDAIDELCRLGFVRESSADHFFFSEDIVRQIVYNSISRKDLILFHRAVGETIETFHQNVLSNYYEQLATHFTIANDSHKALYYSKKAAAKAKDNYAHSVAVKFFENALKYEDDIDEIFKMKFSLAEIYFLTGVYKKAIQHLNVCLKIDPNAYKVYEKLSDIYESLGDYKASIKYCKTGLKMTQGTEAVYTFKANIAWLYTRLSQYVRAQKECDDILKRKQQMNQQVLGDTYVTLGVLNMDQGNFRKADFFYKKSLKIREAMGDKKRIAACYLDLGINYQQKFNIKLSEKYYTRALSIYKEIGYQKNILLTYNNMGTLFSDYDLARAEEYYLKALKQAKLIGARMAVTFLYINLGSINMNRLMDYQAQQNYSCALEIAKEIGLHDAVIIGNLGLSELHRRKGNVKKGKRHLATAYRLAKQYDVKYRIIECQQEEIEYLLLARQVRRADLLAKRIFTKLRREQSIEHKVYSFTYRARIFVELKEFTKAHTYYTKAYNYVKALPPNRIAGEIHYLRGVAYKKEKRHKEALKMFLRANQIFEEVGNLRYLDKIEQEITHGAE